MDLPRPEAHGLPPEATIAVPVPDGGLTLYRLIETDTPRLKDFEPVWTRPQAQLRRIPELFRVSISHWLELDQALAASERRVAFVARVELAPNPLVRAVAGVVGRRLRP